MKVKPPIVMTCVIAGLLVVGVWLAPERTREATRNVSLPISTYNTLRLSGEALRDTAGKPMAVAKVIEALIEEKETTAASELVEPLD